MTTIVTGFLLVIVLTIILFIERNNRIRNMINDNFDAASKFLENPQIKFNSLFGFAKTKGFYKGREIVWKFEWMGENANNSDLYITPRAVHKKETFFQSRNLKLTPNTQLRRDNRIYYTKNGISREYFIGILKSVFSSFSSSEIESFFEELSEAAEIVETKEI